MINLDRLTQKVFNIQLKILYSDGSVYDASSDLKKLRIESNMKEYIMPMIQMKLSLPPEVTVMIQKDSSSVVFSLEVDKSEFDNESLSLGEKFIKPLLLKPLLMDKNLINYSADDESYSIKIPFECVCVPDYSLNTNKVVASGVYKDATITEVILALTNKLRGKLFLSPPDNNKRYDQIVLYPGNIYSNLFHLDNTYGIYNDDLKIFTSYDRVIISPSSSKELLENGNVSVLVRFPNKSESNKIYSMGSYSSIDNSTGKKVKNISIKNTNIGIVDNSELMSEVFGTNTYFNGRSLIGFSERNVKLSKFDRNGNIIKTNILDNKFDNEFSINSLVDKAVNTKLLNMAFSNIDVELLDGFRKFSFNFENENYGEYNGDYRVLSIVHEFTTSSTGASGLNGSIVLRKI